MIQVARNNIVEQDPSNRPTPRLARDGRAPQCWWGMEATSRSAMRVAREIHEAQACSGLSRRTRRKMASRIQVKP
jgi:hypothetical protein